MAEFLTALWVVAVAELADKTQLVALSLAARYGVRRVIAGIAIGAAAVQLLSVAVGTLLGDELPQGYIRIAAGVAFLAFGAWNLVPRPSDGGVSDEEATEEARSTSFAQRFGVVPGIAAAFFLAELGDKTQGAAITVAADVSARGESSWIPVFLGATLGLVLADAAAVFLGAWLSTRLPERLLRQASGAIFIVFGLAILAQALL